MESIKQSVAQMSETFNKRMMEFQNDLQKTSTTSSLASPPSRLASDFTAFRAFVVTSLQCLQAQVDALTQLHDSLEMKYRRKILLVHGIPEGKDENPTSVAIDAISKRLNTSQLSGNDISRCHRMGSIKEGKPRPVLIKFRELHMKQQIWSSKTKFKGSGITLSEFLTKGRHEIFMAARNQFGVSKCWTRDGRIFVMAADGVRHRVDTIGDLKNVPTTAEDNKKAHPSASTSSGEPSKHIRGVSRSRRPTRAK
ncbi:unnamed protein product [Colias eurytheme]|nr:unnamed protein product [Colias eurytheme]CAG4927097.1 unnamed protein product [Colias eurytheme]